MAQLLFDRDSPDKHFNAARRHSRKARQQKKNHLAENLKPSFEAAKAKADIVSEKNELREDAYDDLLMADMELDDSVRNAFAAAQTYDRNSPADAVLHIVFPDRKFGDIVNAPISQEPDMVEQLAIRFESLGESHSLYAQAATLREKINASRAAITAYDDAIRSVKLAEADLEIALGTLRRQYEKNYLDARSEYGKMLAERLFPKLYKTSPAMVVNAA